MRHPSCSRLAAALLFVGFALSLSGPAAADQLAGQRLAERWCARCHAVKADRASPVRTAPRFTQIAQDPAITEYTLRILLQTEHPKMPNLMIHRDDIDDLVDYIMSLKKSAAGGAIAPRSGR